MRYKEWGFLLVIACLGIMTANFVGFKVAFLDSLPGVCVLLVISCIVGLLAACPISPISSFVIESANKINFTAPLTMVGAFAGISIGNEIKAFAKQGWKMIIIALLVMTGTFFGSALVANVILSLTHAI